MLVVIITRLEPFQNNFCSQRDNMKRDNIKRLLSPPVNTQFRVTHLQQSYHLAAASLYNVNVLRNNVLGANVRASQAGTPLLFRCDVYQSKTCPLRINEEEEECKERFCFYSYYKYRAENTLFPTCKIFITVADM